MNSDLASYCQRWALRPDGEAIQTPHAVLLPVIWRERAAMLKLGYCEEEMQAYGLLAWWGGCGAAQVFARSGPALLMERATGRADLAQMSRAGHDDTACRNICDVVAQLHTVRHSPPPCLSPLPVWCAALSGTDNEVLQPARLALQTLLAEPRDVVCLHGDIHHGNILDFGERGWLAIDPKGLTGERTFDYANLFCNPDMAVATDWERFLARVDGVAGHARLQRRRLLMWILAWSGLSAAWHFEDASSPSIALQLGKMAAGALRSEGL